jgi:hypothetical protein
MKTLQSGITVDAAKYYQLLEWKDSNINKFKLWCHEYRFIFAEIQYETINLFTQPAYDALLDFSNI